MTDECSILDEYATSLLFNDIANNILSTHYVLYQFGSYSSDMVKLKMSLEQQPFNPSINRFIYLWNPNIAVIRRLLLTKIDQFIKHHHDKMPVDKQEFYKDASWLSLLTSSVLIFGYLFFYFIFNSNT